MRTLIAIILIVAVFLYWLEGRMKRYYAQKLKDMNEGNIGD